MKNKSIYLFFNCFEGEAIFIKTVSAPDINQRIIFSLTFNRTIHRIIPDEIAVLQTNITRWQNRFITK